jgi:riboflavin biosynthesis pyrimidine reductase
MKEANMAGMLSRAHLSQDMTDIIVQAHAQALRQGFSTIMVGGRFAVITESADLEETLDGFCSQMVDCLMDYRESESAALYHAAGDRWAFRRSR